MEGDPSKILGLQPTKFKRDKYNFFSDHSIINK